jgi:autotransporter translocation and assembly factor TamB
MRHSSRSRRRWAVAGAILLAVALGVYAFRYAIAGGIISGLASTFTGANVSFSGMHLSTSEIVLHDLRIRSRNGEPIATIALLEIGYNLHDLISRRHRAYGLDGIDVENPNVTIIRHRDGSLNVPLPKIRPSSTGGPPLHFTVVVRDGTAQLIDYTRNNPLTHRLAFGSIAANVSVDTAATTRYTASVSYLNGAHAYPITAGGVIDNEHGFMLQRFRAVRIPLVQIVDYAVNNAAIRMENGEIDDFEVRAFAIAPRSTPMHPHFAGGMELRNGAAHVAGLSKPLHDLHGTFDVTDNAITTDGIFGTLGPLATKLSGGLYGLPKAQARFTLSGHAELADFRRLTSFAARLPMRGPIAFRVLAEGSAFAPQVLIRITSPRIVYNGIALTQTRGLVAARMRGVDILGFGSHYGAMQLGGAGSFAFAHGPNVLRLLVEGDAPASSLPFVSGFAPGMTLHGTVLATASDFRLIDTHGFLDGTGPAEKAFGTFHVASNGTGTVGPLFVTRGPGSVYTRIDLDHPHERTVAYVNARDFHIVPSPHVPFGNFRITPIPPFAGTLNANLLGARSRAGVGAVGDASLQNAQFASLHVANAHASFGGALGDLEIPSFHASGAWGSIGGSGGLAMTGAGMLAQLRDGYFATARGAKPLQNLRLTAGMRSGALDLYAASARIGGSDAFASGSFGNGGTLTVTLSGVNLADLRNQDLPLLSGTASAMMAASGTTNDPRVSGVFVVSDARFAKFPLGGSAGIALANGNLNIRDAILRAGPALADMDGRVCGLRAGASPNTVSYTIDTDVRGMDLGESAALINPQFGRIVAGSADATIHVAGTGRKPSISGSFDVPEGSVNGEGFRTLSAGVSGNANGISLSNGRIVLGSSTIAFNGGLSRPGSGRIAMHAPQLNLADFNDFFDNGDTFAGHGHLDVAFSGGLNGDLRTYGNAGIRGARFRQFDLGNASVRWKTTGDAVLHLAAETASSTARFRIRGNVAFPRITAPSQVMRAVRSSDLDLHATARNVVLASWLPPAGITAPITGEANANASVRGRFPNLGMAASADVVHGLFGHIPIQKASFSGTMQGEHGTIQSAFLQIPYLAASASGTFGLAKSPWFNITGRATSPDVGKLGQVVTGTKRPVSGTADTTLHLRGTTAKPSLHDRFTVTSLRYATFAIPRVAGELFGNLQHVALRNGEVDLQHGRLLATALLPLDMRTRSIGPRNAPVSADLIAENVKLSNFESFMGSHTTLGGYVDGHVTIAGTVGSPGMAGELSMVNGSYTGPLDKDALNNVNGRLILASTTAMIQAVAANVGGGQFAIKGRASVPNLYNPKAASFSVGVTATHARVNNPQYYKGQIDAAVVTVYGPHTPLTIGGNVTLSKASIPININLNQPKTEAAPLPVAFKNLRLNVGPGVRGQNSMVDIGAKGNLIINGTPANPKISGEFASTGGILSFYRTFRIQRGIATFNPSSGITPDVDAIATTYLTDPPADVTIHVSGPATNMQLGLSSNPSYDRSQILGLLVGAQTFGAVPGVQSSPGAPVTASGAVQNVAFSQANTVFTRSLLDPASTQIGDTLGLTNFQIYNNIEGGNVSPGVSLVKQITQNVSLSGTESVGYPRRSTESLRYHMRNASDVHVQAYQQQPFFLTGVATNQPLLPVFSDVFNASAVEQQFMNSGTSGFNLTYERRYW